MEKIQNSKNAYVVIDLIEYAEKELNKWNIRQGDMASKLKENEGYIQGVSDMLKTTGKDPDGNISKILNLLQLLLLGFYTNSAQTCDGLRNSISMARSLKTENKFLRQILATVLAINPEAQNHEIESKAKDLGNLYEGLIRERKIREEEDTFREEHR